MVLRVLSEPIVLDLSHALMAIPSVDLMDWMYGPSATWEEWQIIRGQGLGSWLRFVWEAGSITRAEALELLHGRYSSRGLCHRYRSHEYHFCHEGQLADFDRRLEGMTTV